MTTPLPPLDPGEQVLASFAPDRTTYLRAHLIMAVALGAAAGVALVVMGNPYPVTGPLGAAAAIGLRAAYLASEALSDTWHLTNRRLLGPRGHSLPLAQITHARPFLGAVQIITRSGDKHLIKYLADAPAAAARILLARG